MQKPESDKPATPQKSENVDDIIAAHLSLPETGEPVSSLDMSLHDQRGRTKMAVELQRFMHRYVQPKADKLRKPNQALLVQNIWPYVKPSLHAETKGLLQADENDGFSVLLSVRTFESKIINGEEVIFELSHRPQNQRIQNGRIIPDPQYPQASLSIDSKDFLERFIDDPDSLGLSQRARAYMDSQRPGGRGSMDYQVGM